jgi:hypothetical protein
MYRRKVAASAYAKCNARKSTLWFEDRGKGPLRIIECCGFYLLSFEAFAVGLLAALELFSSLRLSKLQNRPHLKS